MVPSSPPTGTHRFSWGIFEVIYDYPIRTFAPFSGSLDHRNLRSALRFLCELRRSAPRPFAIHVLGCVWMSVAPALSLYFSSAILNMISVCILCPHSSILKGHRTDADIYRFTRRYTLRRVSSTTLYHALVFFSSVIDFCGSHDVGLSYLLLLHSDHHTNIQRRKQTIVRSTSTTSFSTAVGKWCVFFIHLRLLLIHHPLPVSLRLDIDLLKGILDECSYHHSLLTEGIDHHFHGVLPDPWGFSEGAPALSFIMDLSARLRNITTLILEILVLFHIILVTRNPDAKFLASLCALCFTFMCFCPSNAIGGAGT